MDDNKSLLDLLKEDSERYAQYKTALEKMGYTEGTYESTLLKGMIQKNNNDFNKIKQEIDKSVAQRDKTIKKYTKQEEKIDVLSKEAINWLNEQAKKVQLQNKKMAKETEELKQQEKKMRSRGVSKGVKKVQPKVREISEPTSYVKTTKVLLDPDRPDDSYDVRVSNLIEPNQAIIDRFAKSGRNVSNLAKGQLSQQEIQKRMVSEYKKVGIGVKFEGNRVGFYSLEKYKTPKQAKWDDIANVEVALLDNHGQLTKGNQKIANLSHLTQYFNPNSGIPELGLTSSYDLQFQNLLNLKGYKEGIESKLVQAIKKGDKDKASYMMKMGVERALEGVPTSVSMAAKEEALKQVQGMKTQEQMVSLNSMYSIKNFAESFFRYKQDAINAIYKTIGSKREITDETFELTPQEYKDFAVAFTLSAWGKEKEFSQGVQPGLLKELLTSDEFKYLRKNAKEASYQDLRPVLESLKEETFLSGILGTSGAQEVLPFGVFGDLSNRALNQVFNYNDRARVPRIGRKQIFGSEIGRLSGVNYDKAEMTQYIGAQVSDSKIYDVISKSEDLRKQLGAVLPSVQEGGIIIPKALAHELASYRDAQVRLSSKKLDSLFGIGEGENFLSGADRLSEALGAGPLSDLKVGETFSINGGRLIGDSKFSSVFGKSELEFLAKEIGLLANDMITGITRTDEGLKLDIRKFEEVNEGTKLLTGSGGRQTARIVSNEFFENLKKGLGLSEKTQYITEKQSIKSKTLMESLRGRVGFFIGEALENGLDKEEILSTLKKTQLGRTFKLVDGKFESSAYYDYDDNEYKYINENGDIAEVFEPLKGETLKDAIRRGVIEGENSDLQFLGKTLLGEEKYASTLGLVQDFINMANEVPYFDKVGSSNVNEVERTARVKFSDRERRAEMRTLADAKKQLGEGLSEGLELFIQDEKKQIENYGEQGLLAQKQIEVMNRSLQGLSNSGGYNPKKRKALNVSFDKEGNLLLNGEKYSGEWTTSAGDWDGSKGVKTEDFKKSIVSILREKQSELGAKDVVLKAGGKSVLLADVAGTYKSLEEKDDYYIPSQVDKTNLAILSRAASLDTTQEQFEEALTQLAKDYKFLATDKNSKLFQRATQSYVGNSGYFKVIGQNAGESSATGEYNTMYTSEESIRQMLSSSQNATASDRAKNIRNLSYMLKAEGAEGVADYSNIKKTSKLNAQKLVEIETELVEGLIERVRNGETQLLSQFHRYPSTSGRDVRFSKLAIDSNMKGTDTLAIPRGLALTVNADYDGDKTQSRLLFAGSDYASYEDFKKAYEAAKQVTALDTKIAKNMELWEKRNAESPDTSGDAVVSDILNREPNIIASLMSKANKHSVGYFSNLSTNVRNFMQDIGIDEVAGAGTKQAGQAAFARAYMETLEQDSISAKKVFSRLSKQEGGENFFVDELDALYNLMNQGAFKTAIEKSQSMGMGFENSRQLELARATLEVYNPELYEKEFASIFNMENGEAKTAKIIEMLEDAFSMITREANARQITAQDFTSSNWKRKDLSNYSQARRDAIQQHEQRAQELSDKVKNKFGSFRTGIAENEADHAITHHRWVNVDGSEFRREQVDSVTGLIHQFDRPLPPWEQEKLDITAAKGTFAHKVAEILGNQNVTKVEDLDQASLKELTQAQIDLENAIKGDATPELIKKLIARAEAVAGIAQKENLISRNAMQEVTLGGKFQGAQKAVAGQADIVSYDDKGLMVGDYKFSSQGGEKIEAERILQASIYMALYEEELLKEAEVLKQAKEKGTLTPEQEQRLSKIQEVLTASEKGRTVKILRSFEKNGQAFVETLTTEAMTREEALEELKHLQGYKELQEKINEIDAQLPMAKSEAVVEALKKQREELEEQQRALIRERSPVSASRILNGRERNYSYVNEQGESVDRESIYSQGSTRTEHNKLINKYTKNKKEQYKVIEDMQRLELTTQREGESQGSQVLMNTYRQRLAFLEEQLRLIDITKLSEEEQVRLNEKLNDLNQAHITNSRKIAASQKQQVGFLQKLVGGFKQQLTYLIDMSLAYQAVGKLKQIISSVIQKTEELDSRMVDLQIATGMNRDEIKVLMKDYVSLGRELGRTTTDVAAAANDWLRAGYEGKEAAELTKGSMMLSTLGMIESAEATKYLISTLKGWKLNAEDVIGVVDKLTAVDMSAAISAGDLALAMSRANNSAKLAGADMNNFIGYVTTVADVSQKSAESVGESFKTIDFGSNVA